MYLRASDVAHANTPRTVQGRRRRSRPSYQPDRFQYLYRSRIVRL